MAEFTDDQPAEDEEHFPWHYTEFGVICACGAPMRNEQCTAQEERIDR